MMFIISCYKLHQMIKHDQENNVMKTVSQYDNFLLSYNNLKNYTFSSTLGLISTVFIAMKLIN